MKMNKTTNCTNHTNEYEYEYEEKYYIMFVLFVRFVVNIIGGTEWIF
jgi:hypothetical protein